MSHVELPPRLIDLEVDFGDDGQPSLFAAYRVLHHWWQAGNRTREAALHLAFLAWYLLLEPEHLTGYDRTQIVPGTLRADLLDAHNLLDPSQTSDPEALYVLGLMAHLCPWIFDELDAELWDSRAKAYRTIYRSLVPSGLPPSRFAGRGAFGDYFASQLSVTDGF